MKNTFFRNGVKAVLLGFCLLTAGEGIAQTPVKQWDKTFGGDDWDELAVTRQTSDGGYILGGHTRSHNNGDQNNMNNGDEDYWILKLDASGNKQWNKIFGGGGYDFLTCLQQTSDGGFILGGRSSSNQSATKSENGKGDFDYWVLKLDASGNKQWDKTFGGTDNDQLFALQQTSDGGYMLGGKSRSGQGLDKTQPAKGMFDFWVIKLDANGAKQWDRTLGGNGEEELYALQQTSDGGYIFGGESFSPINGDKSQGSQGAGDFWLVKTDAAGNKQWDKTFGGNFEDKIRSLQQLTDGSYILGGTSLSHQTGDKTEPRRGNNDCWIVKTDGSGNKIWDKTFGGGLNEFLYSIHQAPDGNLVFGAWSDSNPASERTAPNRGSYDYWLVKIDLNGSKIWDYAVGGNSSDVLSSVGQTADGDFILGGSSASNLNGDKSEPCKGNYDYWVVKLSGGVSGTPYDKLLNAGVKLFPNPAQDKITLSISDLKEPAAITIFNTLGQAVYQSHLKPAGNINQQIKLPQEKGIYMLQLSNGMQQSSHKFLVE